MSVEALAASILGGIALAYAWQAAKCDHHFPPEDEWETVEYSISEYIVYDYRVYEKRKAECQHDGCDTTRTKIVTVGADHRSARHAINALKTRVERNR